MRVLLVEDDPTTSRSIELMLTHANFNVYCTDLGEEAVELGKLYDYDLILLDLNLPDMAGLEVLRQIRVARINTPILILTGEDSTDIKLKGFGSGADDYMTKPFHRDELVARIHAIIRRSQGHAIKRLQQARAPVGNRVIGGQQFKITDRTRPLKLTKNGVIGIQGRFATKKWLYFEYVS